MLTRHNDIDIAIRDLTTELLRAMRTGNPKVIAEGAATEKAFAGLEGVAIEKAFAALVEKILHYANNPPTSRTNWEGWEGVKVTEGVKKA